MSEVDLTGMSIDVSAVENSGTIAQWSENKKDEFCELFATRAFDARRLLNMTAEHIINGAEKRYFIPRTHLYRQRLQKKRIDVRHDGHTDHQEYEALCQIARKRASAILKELPTAKDAVNIIDKPTARLMDQKEKHLLELEELHEALSLLPGVISLSTVPQEWTIAQFREHLDVETNKREKLVKRITKLGEEVERLEKAISTALYGGLPGLREAVEKVVEAHFEKSAYLGTVVRRITEKVKFGDAKEAVELLRSFEKNEVEVSDSVKVEFAEALKKLNVARPPKKVTKKLPVKKTQAKTAAKKSAKKRGTK